MPGFAARTFTTLLLTLLTTPAWAYYAVLDNAEVLGAGKFKLTGDLQNLTDTGGINGAVRFDLGFQDEYGVRGLVGVGKTDVFFGGLMKWMPVPDIENQPAIGFNVGLVYGKDGTERDLTIRFEPLVSKKFKVDDLYLTPYASLPLGLRMRDRQNEDSKTYLATQLVAGSQVQIPKWKNLQFLGEVGVDLGNALSHIAVGAVFYFDGENGPVLE